VIIAIVIPEVPRVVRLVRSVVLSIREEPYVEAGIALGASTPALLLRHVLPNTLAPLIVQSTFVCASAILVEAILSFLGVGIPPRRRPGQHHVRGPGAVPIFPHNILFPGLPGAHRAGREHPRRRPARLRSTWAPAFAVAR
jgi:peptide/nickel transport system permease protein